jgi:uncharacterized membrane protein
MTVKLGARVSLAEQAGAHSLFLGWSGACGGTSDCTIAVNGDQAIWANFSATVPPPPPPTSYVVVELPAVEGSPVLIPAAINGRGDVVGVVILQNGGPARAFFYDGAAGSTRRILDDGSNSDQVASGINDTRQVSGRLGSRGVRWENDQITNIGTLSTTYSISEALGINAAGVVVGSSSGDDGKVKAVLWDGSTLRKLQAAGQSEAHAVNSNNIAVGIGGATSPRAVAFLNDTVLDLGGADGGLALAVSDVGRIVGMSNNHAFVYDLPQGPMRDVSPNAKLCYLYSVNHNGVAVGVCDGLPQGRGVILRGGTVEFLDDVIQEPTWVFYGAQAINDRGQIVGVGSHRGQGRAYLITPR